MIKQSKENNISRRPITLKKFDIQQPLDPTHDMQNIMNDTTGLTGITVDSPDDTNMLGKYPDNHDVSRSMSQAEFNHAKKVATGKDEPIEARRKLSSPKELARRKINQMTNTTPVGVEGEESVSGDMPDPASDDDVLTNEQQVGLRENEDSEHPEELDIGSEVDKAEEYERSH